jgi:hypothetical protein
MAGRFALPLESVFDANGVPRSGAKLEFFASGTSDPLDTFSDDALTTANANPVVADSAGMFDDIFLSGDDYKVVLKDADDVTIWTADPVRSATPKTSVVISKTTTYTVAVGDDGKLIAADATAGAFTITLPVAATAGDGFEISVVKIDSSANAVTIDGDGSETINDESDLDLADQFDAAVLRSDGSEWFTTVRPSSITTPLPRGYIDGFTISNNGADAEHDIDIATGAARDEDNEANLSLSTTLTKAIDAAWAVGDGNGGLDTGSVGNATWYYVWLIRRSDTGVVDALFSTSSSSPTMPTNYDQRRLLGAVFTNSSANIAADQFVQVLFGGELRFTSNEKTPVADTKLDVAHGLTSAPLQVQLILRCTVDDAGYVAGDEILTLFAGGTTDRGVSILVDATNVSLIQSAGIQVIGKTSFNGEGITTTSWRWVVRAWA